MLALTHLALVYILIALSNSLKVATWRKMINEKTTVSEWAVIMKNEKEILMMSSDAGLVGTGFNQSASLHDFEKKFVALKNFDAVAPICYITDVLRDFEVTLLELSNRHSQNESIERTKNEMVASKITQENLKRYSPKLAEYCDDAKEIYWLDDKIKFDRKINEGGTFVEKESLICIWIVVIILVFYPTATL